MDEPSRNVVRFIEALSSHVWGDVLYGGQDGLWMKLVRRGLKPTRPGMTISIGTGPRVSLILSIVAELGPERELDFEVLLRPDGETWLIETGVYVHLWPEGEGMKTVRSFPDRRAATLDECLAQWSAAVADLATCDDVVDQDL